MQFQINKIIIILLILFLFLITIFIAQTNQQIIIQTLENFNNYNNIDNQIIYWKIKYIDEETNDILDYKYFNAPKNFIFKKEKYIKNINNYDLINTEQISENEWIYKYKKQNIITQISKINNKKRGNYGRLYIPCVNIDVAINWCINHPSMLNIMQQYVDEEDSACMSPYGVESFLCDHYHQGFSAINNINIGDKMYIDKNNGEIETWICTYGGNGNNGVHNYLTFNGKSIGEQNTNGICLYTCNGNDSWNVIMRFFQRI